jgi:hypothetical protein
VAAAEHMLLQEAPDIVNAAIADAITAESIVGADRDLDDLDATPRFFASSRSNAWVLLASSNSL